MFSTVYRVTQKDFYACPYMRMRDLQHNSDNDDLELIKPHMLINSGKSLNIVQSAVSVKLQQVPAFVYL